MPAEFGSVDHILEQLGLNNSPLGGSRSSRATPGVTNSDTPKDQLLPERTVVPQGAYLDLPVGKHGVSLSAEQCLLLVGALDQVRSFATTERDVLLINRFGQLRTESVRGVRVLECTLNGAKRPLRMTKEKVALVLAFEREIRRFASLGGEDCQSLGQSCHSDADPRQYAPRHQNPASGHEG